MRLSLLSRGAPPCEFASIWLPTRRTSRWLSPGDFWRHVEAICSRRSDCSRPPRGNATIAQRTQTSIRRRYEIESPSVVYWQDCLLMPRFRDSPLQWRNRRLGSNAGPDVFIRGTEWPPPPRR